MPESENKPFFASRRSDRHANPVKGQYRFLTLEECKSLHGRVDVLDRNGQVCQVSITSVKTWKTRPDVRIGWKYGLYEYGQELITCDADNSMFLFEMISPEEMKEQVKIASEIVDEIISEENPPEN